MAKRDELEPGTRCIIKKEGLTDLNGRSLYGRIVNIEQIVDTGVSGKEVAKVIYEDKQPGMSYVYCKHLKPQSVKKTMYAAPRQVNSAN